MEFLEREWPSEWAARCLLAPVIVMEREKRDRPSGTTPVSTNGRAAAIASGHAAIRYVDSTTGGDVSIHAEPGRSEVIL